MSLNKICMASSPHDILIVAGVGKSDALFLCSDLVFSILEKTEIMYSLRFAEACVSEHRTGFSPGSYSQLGTIHNGHERPFTSDRCRATKKLRTKSAFRGTSLVIHMAMI